MKWLLNVLGGSLGPYIAGAVGAALLASLAFGGIQSARLSHAKGDLSKARAALIDPATRKTWESEAKANARDLAQCRENTATLQAVIDTQNKAVEGLKADGERRAKMLADALVSARKDAANAQSRADALLKHKTVGADVCAQLLDVDAAVQEAMR